MLQISRRLCDGESEVSRVVDTVWFKCVFDTSRMGYSRSYVGRVLKGEGEGSRRCRCLHLLFHNLF